MKFKQIVFSLFWIVVFSFLLNFLWESLHGYSLYADHVIDSDKYVGMMLYMSFMDAVTILVIYLVCAFFMKDALWLKNVTQKRVTIFGVLCLFVAVVAEYWAVYVTHEWHYNKYMLQIFGIGLSPLVQLSVTGIMSLWITKKVIS